MEKEPIIRISNLHVQFYTRRGIYKALRGVDLTLYKGEVLGIAGESGSGKTTLGLAIMGLFPRNAIVPHGEIIIGNGIDILETIRGKVNFEKGKVNLRKNELLLKKLHKNLQRIRGKQISIVFQEPMTALNPVLQIGYQIAETIFYHDPERLIRRALAREKVKIEDLKEMIRILKVEGERGIKEYAKNKGIEGIEEQVISIWERENIHESKKEKLILDLAKYKPSFLQKIGLRLAKKGFTRIPIISRIVKRALISEGYKVAIELLSSMGISQPEAVVKLYPHELSGGMRQRVAIAIALANNPDVVILDEPTSALDVTIQAQILDLIKRIKNKTNASFIFISHDLSVLAEVSDRLAIMYAGKIMEVGRVEQIFSEPLHPYTQMLMTVIPTIDKEILKPARGSIPDMRYPPQGCAFSPRCPFAKEICFKLEPRMIEVSKDHKVACVLYEEKK